MDRPDTPLNAGREPREDHQARHDAYERLGEVILRAGRGDDMAMDQLYKQTSGKLYALLLEMLPEPGAADEVLRDSYLAIWRGASRFSPGQASPMSWLISLARNKAIDRLRGDPAARRSHALDDLVAEDAGPPSSELTRLAADRRRARVYYCLDRLEEGQCDAIRAAFFAGGSYEALALGANMPADILKGQIMRGLARLRKCLHL